MYWTVEKQSFFLIVILKKRHIFAVGITKFFVGMEKIVINPKGKKALVKKYGATNVSKALSYKANSQMAKEIRHEAMNLYDGHLFTF